MAIVKKKAVPAKPAKPKKVAAVVVPEPIVYVSTFSVGNRVTHPSFGDGKVMAVVRDQLSIKFATAEKVVLDSFVKMASKS